MSNRVALVAQHGGLDLFTDGPLLSAALAEEGLTAEIVSWGERRDWSRFAGVIVRATYDYIDRPAEFLAWAKSVETASLLANSAAVLEWNADKRYLRDLAGAGVPIVPTSWLSPGESPETVLAEAGRHEIVVKPATSAGSRLAARYTTAEHEGARKHLRRLAELGLVAMVQPYLSRVDHDGEAGTFLFGGELSHAISKSAALKPSQPAVEDFSAGFAQRVTQLSVTDELADFARRTMACLPAGLDAPLYARIDTLRDDDGGLVLVELELIEPFLFLETDAAAASNFAKAAAAWIVT